MFNCILFYHGNLCLEDKTMNRFQEDIVAKGLFNVSSVPFVTHSSYFPSVMSKSKVQSVY